MRNMGLRKIKILFLTSILLISYLGLSLLLGDNVKNSSIGIENQNNRIEKPELNEVTLPDKVYTFLAPSDSLEFELYLEDNYMYYVYVELVTPFNCTMVITIWDSDGKQFDIFESDMFYDPEYGRWFEVPFGTAKKGTYTILFSTESDYSFNLYIQMTQGPKCLYDKMSSTDNLKLHKVNTFAEGDDVQHEVKLESDMMYKFYVGRVSAISIEESNTVNINYTIQDPDGVEFVILDQEDLPSIDAALSFFFGTACEGMYKIKIAVDDIDVAYVNLAYAIAEDYQISEIEDNNETDSDSTSEQKDFSLENLWDNSTSIPPSMLAGVFIFTGILATGAIIAFYNHKRKKKDSLDANIGKASKKKRRSQE